jgi:hypothetical protein
MGILKNNPLQLASTFKATYHCSTNKHLRSEVGINMLIARIFIVCLIIYRCATKEFSITPLEDALCCNLSYYALENITLDDSSDTTIELIFYPGNHRLYHFHYALSSYRWYRKLLDWIMINVKQGIHRSATNDTSSIIKLNKKRLKCLSTEVAFSNSVLTVDDQFSTTSFNEQDELTTTECNRTVSSHNTLREPLLHDV